MAHKHGFYDVKPPRECAGDVPAAASSVCVRLEGLRGAQATWRWGACDRSSRCGVICLCMLMRVDGLRWAQAMRRRLPAHAHVRRGRIYGEGDAVSSAVCACTVSFAVCAHALSSACARLSVCACGVVLCVHARRRVPKHKNVALDAIVATAPGYLLVLLLGQLGGGGERLLSAVKWKGSVSFHAQTKYSTMPRLDDDARPLAAT